MAWNQNGLFVLLAALWLVYAVWLAIWVVMQKRDPAATLAWLFALVFLPYLGFLVFYVFGPRRIKRNRSRRQSSYEAIRKAFAADTGQQAADSPHELAVELTHLVQQATGMPLSTCTSIRLLVNGSPKYDSLLEDIAAASPHVHREYYIYAGDRTGSEIRDALIAARQRGVEVRLLMDGAGSFQTSDAFLEPLKQSGAEVSVFHPVLRGVPNLRPLLNFRSHRKIAVIDGRIGYTGGINVTDDENDRLNPEEYFRDIHSRIEGEAVSWMQRVFLEDWHYAAKKTPTGNGYFVKAAPGKYAVQLIPSGPDNSCEPIHRALLTGIYSAHARVWVATPYFVPTEPAWMALSSAAMRGLDVRLMLPKKSDSRLVDLAARSYFDELLRNGVRIFEYQSRMLHIKSLVVDDAFAILGSANFDSRSLRTNFEMSMAVHEPEIVTALEAVWATDMAESIEITKDRPKASFARRLGEATARLGSPLL
jgi:cardiolipin synthase